MSVKALDAVFDRSQATGAAFTVLIAMADWADHQGRCYPSFAQIARKARVSRQTVASAIRELIALGELERVTRGHAPTSADEDDDPQTVRSQWRNVYRILLMRRKQVVQPLDHPATAEVVQPVDHQVVQPVDHPDDFSTDHPQVVQPVDYLANAGSQIDASQVVKSTHAHIRNEPSVEPSEELKAGAPPRPPQEIPETPDDNVGVITKLVHETLDFLGDGVADDFLREAVLNRVVFEKIRPYSNTVVNKAVDSARWQRRRRRESA